MRRDSERIYHEYLVAAARTGDTGALQQLVSRFEARLLAHAWRLTNDLDMARDATQEAWIEIIRGLPRLLDAAAFPAWSFRIVSRRCARSIRQNQHRRRVRDAMVNEAAVNDCATADAGLISDARSAADALEKLPPGQRAAIALFYLEELSVAEISVALDVPVGTVKTRLLHARRKLRAILEGDDDA